MVKLTGEDLRVAVSEEMPFAYKELGESPSLSALLKYMKSHLLEANFSSNTEELCNILLDYVGSDINESIYNQMNKIDDNESLNEKYNVRTLKDVKKLTEAAEKTLMNWNDPTHVERVKRVAKDCKFNLSPLYKKETMNSYIEDIEDAIMEMKKRLDQRADSNKEIKSWSIDYTCILLGWVRVTYTDGSKDKVFLW